MPPDTQYQAFRGTLVDCPEFGLVRVREDAICVVDQSLQGKIICIKDGNEESNVLEALGVQPGRVMRLKVRPVSHVAAAAPAAAVQTSCA